MSYEDWMEEQYDNGSWREDNERERAAGFAMDNDCGDYGDDYDSEKQAALISELRAKLTGEYGEPTTQTLRVEYYDTQHGIQHRTYTDVAYDTVVFANGVLQFEQDVKGELRIRNFCYHGPFDFWFESPEPPF